ncbi:MAG: threonine-phosphate decarboxylase [Deltaproteobacteria bacterium]|nr:threonine-phosphate decarboxylase [Deltaproteobacteria bacterium]
MNKTHGGNIWQIAKENTLKPEDIIDFSSSINPLGMSPKAIAALKEIHKIIPSYPEPSAFDARQELSRFHNIPIENILAGNGSTEFIYLIPQIFKPKKTLIIEPAFSEYRNSLEICGCKVETYPLWTDFKSVPAKMPDIEKIYLMLKNNYDLVYLGNPANPTGALLKKGAILKIADECKKYSALLMVDEAFIDFAEEESIKKEAVERDNLIVIRSMTKFFAMAGLRFGYLISSQKIVKNIASFQPPWSVNTIASMAAIASLKDTNYIEDTKKWFTSESEFLFEELNSIHGLKAYPSRANYFLAEIMIEGITSKMLYEMLLKNSIIIRDCSSFGLGESFFRTAVKGRKENTILLEGLKKILASQVHLFLA